MSVVRTVGREHTAALHALDPWAPCSTPRAVPVKHTAPSIFSLRYTVAHTLPSNTRSPVSVPLGLINHHAALLLLVALPESQPASALRLAERRALDTPGYSCMLDATASKRARI